eukprot:GSMAST32.ASY1.ANO1.561.1 assembled CDS
MIFDTIFFSRAAVQVYAVVGVIWIGQFLLSLLLNFRFFRFLCGERRVNFRKCKGWAVVTGATDGIGKALAVELARRGLSIVLISRTQSRLDAAAAECLAAGPKGIKTKTVQVDFSLQNAGIYEKLEEALQGLNISVLINNVGVSYPHAQYLLNVKAMMRVSKIVLKNDLMKAGSVIINVASGAGIISSDPLYAGYAGSKSFVDAFSRSLAVELRPRKMYCHCPLFVVSKLAKIRKPSFFVPTPADYATVALNSVYEGKRVTIVPHWPHRLQLYMY